jgi:Uri superfamily endonuclease
MAYALNRLPNHIEPIGALDQTCDAHLFTLQPKWLQNVYEYLLKGVMLERLTTSQR